MPYDTSSLLQTQADINQLAFSDPFNPVNMNPGSWGVNSNLLTPSYTGIYRPQWQGDPGYGIYAGAYGRFWPEVNRTFNPFAPPPYGGQNSGMPPYFQNAGTYTSIVQRPVDRIGSFAQHWAVPLAAQYGLQNMGWRMGSAVMRGTLGEFGAGLLGASEGGLASMAMGGAAGLAGGLLGAWALPAAAVSLADQGFAHYAQQRRTSQNMLSDFGLANFGGQGGNLVTGQGLSRREAASIAKHLDVAGAKSWTFSSSDYSQMADSLIKNGSLDNADFKHLKTKMDEAAASVQALMMLGSKSKEAAVEILGNMKLSGANFKSAVSSFGQLQRAASIGGTTVDYLMSTVGEQGNYMFSSAGLTPYIGANVASNAYASYRNAYRQGLLSPAFMAQMGGIGGLTQSYTSGALQLTQTPINDMMGYLMSKGQSATGGLMGSLAKFGAGATANPIDTMGAMGLGRQGYQSEMAKHPDALVRSFLDNVSSLHMPHLQEDKNGQMSAEQAYVALTQVGGLSPDAAKAIIAKNYAVNSLEGAQGIVAGDRAAMINARMTFLQQAHQNYGLLNPAVASYNTAASAVSSWIGEKVGRLNGSIAGSADDLEKWVEDSLYGLPTDSYQFFGKKSSGEFNPLLVGAKKKSLYNSFDLSLGMHMSAADKNSVAFNESRKQFLSGGGAEYLQELDKNMSTASNADQEQFRQLFSAPYSADNASKIRGLLSRMTPDRRTGYLDNFMKYYNDTKGTGTVFDTHKQISDQTRLSGLYASNLPLGEAGSFMRRGMQMTNALSSKMPFGYMGGLARLSSSIAGHFIDMKGASIANPMAASVLATKLMASGNLKGLDENSQDVKDFVAAVGQKGLSGDALRQAIRSLADHSIQNGSDVTNTELYNLAKAATNPTSKNIDAYAASMPGMTGKEALAHATELSNYLKKMKVNPNDQNAVYAAIYKGVKDKNLNPDLKASLAGLIKASGIGDNVDLKGQSDDFIAAYHAATLQSNIQTTKDTNILNQLRHGVQTGAITYDTYYKTMVAQQEKKDYKVFADAVQVFANTMNKTKKGAAAAEATLRADLHLSGND